MNATSQIERQQCVMRLLQMACVCVPLAAPCHLLYAETWHEDFTDGDLSDDSGLQWSIWPTPSGAATPLGMKLTSDPNIPSVGGARVVNLGNRQGWSIRGQGKLLQSVGVIGPAVAIVDSGQDSIWSFVGGDGDMQLGSNLDGLSSSVVTTDLNPFDEEVVFQLDTLDGRIRLWAWDPDNPPEAEVPPIIDESFDIPSGNPTLWTLNDTEVSTALFSWVTISTEHIPIPEPSAAILGALAFVMLGASERKRARRHRKCSQSG